MCFYNASVTLVLNNSVRNEEYQEQFSVQWCMLCNWDHIRPVSNTIVSLTLSVGIQVGNFSGFCPLKLIVLRICFACYVLLGVCSTWIIHSWQKKQRDDCCLSFAPSLAGRRKNLHPICPSYSPAAQSQMILPIPNHSIYPQNYHCVLYISPCTKSVLKIISSEPRQCYTSSPSRSQTAILLECFATGTTSMWFASYILSITITHMHTCTSNNAIGNYTLSGLFLE